MIVANDANKQIVSVLRLVRVMYTFKTPAVANV